MRPFGTISVFSAIVAITSCPAMASDSLSDLVTVYRSGTEVRLYSWLSAGNGFDNNLTWRQEPTFNTYASTEVDWLSGDYDGDGQADVATVYRSGTRVMLYVWSSAGYQFNNWVKWQDTTSFNGYASTEVKWLSADVDGDGKDDLVTVYRNGTRVILYVWKSTGSGFNNWVKWRDIDTFNPYGSTEIDWLAGDVTGDGRADLVTVYRNNKRVILYVWKATSWNTFTGWSKWRDINNFNTYYSSTEIKWLNTDANGDGKDDIVTVYRSGERVILYFWKSFGTGFNSWTKWQDTNTFNTLASTEVDWLAADIDGNGDGDIITIYRNGTRAILYAWVSMGSSFHSWSKWRDMDAFNSHDTKEIKWLVADIGRNRSTSLPVTGYGGLTEVSNDRSEGVTSVQANAGYSTVYQTTVAANAGDLLRIHGQVEVTSEYSSAVRGAVRVQANGQTIGTIGESLVFHPDNHHMPLWADGYYEVPSTGDVVVTAQVSASVSGGNPNLVVEQGYGQVLVEQYRPYTDGSAAANDGAQGLSHWGQEETEDATTYGAVKNVRTTVYDMDVDVAGGDTVLLTSQATTDHDSIEMHGQGIYRNDDAIKISPWATENNSSRSVRLPIYNMAVDLPTSSATNAYKVKLHGVITGGNHPIYQGGGYIHGLVFRSNSATQGLRFAGEGETLVDSFWGQLGAQRVGAIPMLTSTDSTLRITGAVQLGNDSGFMNQCESYIKVLDRFNTVVTTSVSTRKYTNLDTDPLLLRTELIAAPGPDFHTAELWVNCAWGFVEIDATGTRLRVEQWE